MDVSLKEARNSIVDNATNDEGIPLLTMPPMNKVLKQIGTVS
jgi:hypothetical protein